MRPGVVMISNYVVGSKKSYSGIIDYYERYEKKNDIEKNFQVEDRESLFLAYEKKTERISDSERKIIESFESYREKGGSEDFISFVKQKDNEKEVSYGNYINYMNKNVKSSGLFGEKSNHFSFEEKIRMKMAFNEAQENGSVLWGNVYSFDNEFLKKYKLMDEKTGHLNEIKIKEAVRESINTMMKEENIDKSATWCGEIHYDTDNIHVHTSIVEMKNTRPLVQIEKMKKVGSKEYERTGEYELQPKAKLKKKTLDKMKSTFANKLIDRTQDLQLISDRRFQLHHAISLDKDDVRQKRILEVIKENLPENKGDWQYNNRKLDNVRPLIDQYTEHHLNKYHKKEFEEYKGLLNKEEEYYKEIYGEGKEDRYKDYSANKLKELKTKTGNELLREMKKDEKSISYIRNTDIDDLKIRKGKMKLIDRDSYHKNYNHSKGEGRIKFHKPIHIHKINYAVKTTLRSEKRNRELEHEHNQLQQNIERDRIRQEYER